MLPPFFDTDPFEYWYDLKAQLIWVYDGAVTAYRECPYPAEPAAGWLIRRGAVTMHFGRKEDTYRQGNWVFPRAQDGRQTFSADAEILSVRFHAKWPTGQPLFDRSETVVIPAAQEPSLTRIGTRLARLVQRKFANPQVELMYRRGSATEFFDLQRLFYSWMKTYASAMTQANRELHVISRLDERIRTVVHHIETQNPSQPVREKALAGMVGLSTSQLNRLFVRDTGCTPADYWERKRALVAKLAIMESSKSIKAVAYDLGFSSLPHFSKWIKKKLGASPRQLRAGHVEDRTPLVLRGRKSG